MSCFTAATSFSRRSWAVLSAKLLIAVSPSVFDIKNSREYSSYLAGQRFPLPEVPPTCANSDCKTGIEFCRRPNQSGGSLVDLNHSAAGAYSWDERETQIPFENDQGRLLDRCRNCWIWSHLACRGFCDRRGSEPLDCDRFEKLVPTRDKPK